LYGNNSRRDIATTNCINQGLKEDRLCIYASVNACDRSNLYNVSSKIKDYKENIKTGNLLIIDLKPFYNSALRGDLTPFEELVTHIKQELEHRNSKSVLIVADCADNLFQNQYFNQSELLESWWHRIYKEWMQHEDQEQDHITIICPHLDSLLYKQPFDQHKCKIFDNHSVTIDIEDRTIMTSSTLLQSIEKQPQPAEPTISLMESQTHILVAEPEPDLQHIYNMWLRSKGFKNTLITHSGIKCLAEITKIEKITQKSNVIVILDSHIRDIPFIEVAKEIVNRKSCKQIIFTTTQPWDGVKSMTINNNSKILLKPFRFSELLSLLGNSIGN
jgi:CheY-like chemotaxis protein